MKVAVIGSGISGLAAAHRLKGLADVTLLEAGDYFGGHTHTVDITLDTPTGPRTHGVDTGFLVFNDRTYPQLIAFFAELGVPSADSDMSFSVQTAGGADAPALEWSGTSLDAVFAQRSNLLRPRFWRMLADVMRFNKLATGLALRNADAELVQPLGEFLNQHNFSREFKDWYFLPMMACIWSCPTDQMLAFPVATMVRFCHNHGLIALTNRPQWRTVPGGARQYVDKILAGIADKRLNAPVQRIDRLADGVLVQVQDQTERFDKVVIATHSDQALALLADASGQERQTLSAIRYQPNHAVLHTDALVLPRRKKAWAAWNYQRTTGVSGPANGQNVSRVCLHYLLNMLQPLPFSQPVVVSLNPAQELDPALVHGRFDYAHPVLDLAAIEAQKRLPAMQGGRHTYFCGAWTGYGFHEDGLKSGLAVADALKPLLARGT
jgi:predicted NAD/FAD-binding protein